MRINKTSLLITAVITTAIVILVGLFTVNKAEIVLASDTWWDIQSVDTMKFSRDLAREKLNDEDFVDTIDFQIKNIASLGATHVAIGTPYDEEFVPFLRRWVEAARKYNLNVWFRGNFAGWEKWFGYEPINREEHLSKLEKFIVENPELFEDGDIFTSCPECENGGPGDPRKNGQVVEHRNFLVEEFEVADTTFNKIGKAVRANYFSMNGDVAELVMDKDTTYKLGGIVVVDHYVGTPEELLRDVRSYAESSGGKIVLGEIGVPIPDIHGEMTEDERASWQHDALAMLASEQELLGINYWVFSGGSTALWNIANQKTRTAEVLQNFYRPKKLTVKITNELGHGISGANVAVGLKSFHSDKNGSVEIAVVPGIDEITISAEGYKSFTQGIIHPDSRENIILKQERESLLFRIIAFIRKIFAR